MRSSSPSRSQSTTAGMQSPMEKLEKGLLGMPLKGFGSTRTNLPPGLDSNSRSSVVVLKITSKSPSLSQSTTMASSFREVLMSANARKGFLAETSRTKCLECPRHPVWALVSHHQPWTQNGRRSANFVALRQGWIGMDALLKSQLTTYSAIMCSAIQEPTQGLHDARKRLKSC